MLTSEFKMLAATTLHESAHNPRQHQNRETLLELAESIRKVGILTPLLVRPNRAGYEIAAGHRRFRAAKVVGLESLPCLVRELDDQAFMEILTIENLQRDDVHPLDEAKGYEALMAAPYKMDVHSIASRVGRSVKYIYDRVKLLALSKELQALFWEGHLTAGHAILLARLSPSDQAKLLGSKKLGYLDGHIFQPEHTLYDPNHEDEEPNRFKARSVRELEAVIDTHVRFDRAAIDPMLFPETAAAVQHEVEACTSKSPSVFKSVVPITYDFMLNDDTRTKDERTYTCKSWRRADGKQGSKTCDHAMLGCVVAGIHRGESFDVCIDRKTCKIHWGTEIKSRAKAEKAATNGQSGPTVKDKWAKQREAEELKWKREREARERWQQAEPKIIAAVLERVKTLPTKATSWLADQIVEYCEDCWRTKHVRITRGASHEDLIRYLGARVLVERATDYVAHETFSKTATYLGIDLSTILPAEAKAVQTSARKAAKKGRAS